MIQAGDKLPEAIFQHLSHEGVKELKLSELTKDKKVVIFAVPGAFTPTCTNKHLPGFMDHAEEIKAKGVDQIYCIAVNDAFVMAAWAEAHSVGNTVMMLADGNCTFTKSCGLEMDATSYGMGIRSKRYSMIVDKGVVQILNLELPGVCELSTATTILGQL